MSTTIVLGVAVFGLLTALFLMMGILKKDPGTEIMQRISGSIRDGAMAFLKIEYSVIAVFVIALFILLLIGKQTQMAIAFLVGACASGLAGWLGM